MTKIGPFFLIQNKLIFNACPLSDGREQAGKLDNSYGHDQLYDANFTTGDYIDYPRGRVIWDMVNNRAMIYIDPCINNDKVIKLVVETFDLENYTVKYDDHYHCKKCIGELFD